MEILESIILLLGAGLAAGFIAGLAGIGGGMLVVPALFFIFHGMDLDENGLMHLAAGTSLCIMIGTSISSIISHEKADDIIWSIFRKVLPGIIIGVVAGGILAYFIPSRMLAVIFGVIMILVSLTMITGLAAKKGMEGLPPSGIIIAAGSVIGFKSGLLGVGGGALSVPFLTWCGLPVAKISGTSSTFTLPAAVTGTIVFLATGYIDGMHMPWTTGYVYWPAVLTVGAGSIVMAPLGSKLSHHVPRKGMRIGFGFLLLFLGIRMILP